MNRPAPFRLVILTVCLSLAGATLAQSETSGQTAGGAYYRISVPAVWNGDLVIWNSDLPHGSSPNKGTRPRVSQYITMYPAPDAPTEEWRTERETWWQERLTGLGGNKEEKEHEEGETAQLTPLGQKLLGVDPW